MVKIIRAGLSLWILGLWLPAGAMGVYTGLAAAADDSPTIALRAQYSRLNDELAHNQFKRPVHLESTETSSQIKGDIYALIDYPFATANAALNDPVKGPDNWCDVMMLHLNTKFCHATTTQAGTRLAMSVGKKYDQPLEDAYHLDFTYHVKAATADYFAVELAADSGPLGTRDYRILLEAVSVEGKQTFMHLTYAYAYGFAGRIALKSYLATAGSSKVGFTINGKPGSNQPDYIKGVRGMVERNAMRYYLAIDAYLSALNITPASRTERRLTTWFDATEQYPRQLHEVERDEYLAMKHSEYQRQQMPL